MSIYKGTQIIKHIYKGSSRIAAVFKGSNLVYPMGTMAGWAIADYGVPHIFSYVNGTRTNNLSIPQHDMTSDNFYAPNNINNNHYFKTNFLGTDFITDNNGTPCIRVAENFNANVQITVTFEALSSTGNFPIAKLITMDSTPNRSFGYNSTYDVNTSTNWTPISYTFTHNLISYPYTTWIYPICVNTHLTQIDNTINFRSISIWVDKM